MKRREFLLVAGCIPVLITHKPKYKGAKQGPTYWTSVDPSYPKMDRLVNAPTPADDFYMHPNTTPAPGPDYELYWSEPHQGWMWKLTL